MVNTNVIISVSAVLVAMLLTIVSLMRQSGDPTDNFSVSVTGTVEREGASYPADMYFCTGDDCQFYGGVPEGQFTPGYFSLVGFNDGTNSYVTEHTVGKTFVYDSSGNLVDCRSSEKVGKQELSQKMSNMKESFQKNERSSEGYTMTNYVMNANPSTDSPTVVGFGVASIEACKAIWKAQSDSVVNAEEVEADVDEDEEDERRNLLGWDDDHKVNITGKHLAHFAGWAYSGDGLNKKDSVKQFDKIKTCKKKNGTARFATHRPTVVLAFAGTDDLDDVIQDLDDTRAPRTTFHGVKKIYSKGYYKYTENLMKCVLDKVEHLEKKGQTLDFVTGHSLGGAASVIFQDISGHSALAVTFGQPAHVEGKEKDCEESANNVRRFFQEYDPVASQIVGRARKLTFDSSHAYKCWNKNGKCTEKWWFGAWGWQCVEWKNRKYYNKLTDCGRKATGCDYYLDCIYNIGNHMMGEYLRSDIGDIKLGKGAE